MKNRKGIRKLLALSLVLALFLPFAQNLMASAEEEPLDAYIHVNGDTVHVYVWNGTSYVNDNRFQGSVIYEGDLLIEHPFDHYYNDALYAVSIGEDAEFTVDGSVKVVIPDDHNTEGRYYGVRTLSHGNDAEVNISGDLIIDVFSDECEPIDTGDGELGNTYLSYTGINTDSDYEPEYGEKGAYTNIGRGIDVSVTAEGELSGAVAVGIIASAEEGTEPTTVKVGMDETEDGAGNENKGNVSVNAKSDGKDAGSAAIANAITLTGYGDKNIMISGTASAEATMAGKGSAEATGVLVSKAGTNNVSVDGDVTATATAENGSALSKAVYVETEGGETAITVGGSVTATADGTEQSDEMADAIAIYAHGWSDTVIHVTVDGDTTAKTLTQDGSAQSISADSRGEKSLTEVSVGGNTEGIISAESFAGSTTRITVDGSAEVEGFAETGVFAASSDATTEVTIQNGLTAKDSVFAAEAYASGEESLTKLTINGGISATGSGDTYAAYLDAASGNIEAVFDGGEITATGKKATDDGFTQGYGLVLENNGGSINVEVNADISAKGADENTGILIDSTMLEAYTPVGEPVEIENIPDENEWQQKRVDGEEVDAFLYNGEVYMFAGEGLYQRLVYDAAANKGEMNVTVQGDVTADNYGLNLSVNKGQTAKVTVNGTVTGGEAGVILTNDNTVLGEDGNVELTVWRIEPDDQGVVVVRNEYDEDTDSVIFTEDTEAEKAVNYIIRLAESFTSMLKSSALKTAKGNTAEIGEETYSTANEEEEIIIEVEKDKDLEGIYYNDEAENKELMTVANGKLKSENGKFILTMLRGGGMLLGLKFHEHTKDAVQAVEATCEADGNIAYWYCSECEKYFSDAAATSEITKAQTVLKATGHSLKAVAAKDPTCTEAGNIAYWYCEKCKKYFSDAAGTKEITQEQTVLKATGHNLKAVAAVAATETTDGNIAYWYCEECGKYFSDAAGTKEITKEQTVAKATGHSLKAVAAVAATETTDGNIAYWYCEGCGKYFSDAEGTKEITKEQTVVPATGAQQAANNEQTDTTQVSPAIASVYNLLKLKSTDDEHKAELTFRSNGTYQIKSPEGNEQGTFALEDGQIILTSETGKKMPIEDGILAYIIGDQTYQFKFDQAELEKLAAVKK